MHSMHLSRHPSRVLNGALERLEPCARKRACTVLRGGNGRKAVPLPDHPKPSYIAYAVMARQLRGLPFAGSASRNGIEVYRFEGPKTDLLVVWAYPRKSISVSLRELGIPRVQVVAACDLVGTPVSLAGGSVRLGPSPLYLAIRR